MRLFLPPIAFSLESTPIAPSGPSAGQARAAKRHALLMRGRLMTLVWNVGSLPGLRFTPLWSPLKGDKREEKRRKGSTLKMDTEPKPVSPSVNLTR